MGEPYAITSRVLDALVSAGLLTSEQASVARQMIEADQHGGRYLVERGLITAAELAGVLEGELGIPRVDLSSYAPDDSALELVPAQTAHMRAVLPLFEIEGMLTVAIGDPLDVFVLDALSAELGVEVEPVLADQTAVREAILAHYGEPSASAVVDAAAVSLGAGTTPQPFPSAEDDSLPGAAMAVGSVELEAPAGPSVVMPEGGIPVAPMSQEAPSGIDLDILAVAESGRVAVLVSDILAHAVGKGASRIHLLPYKDDFFLVYRSKGRLEQIGAAPLSLLGALADGFKAIAHLPQGPVSGAQLGRVRTRILDRDLVLTVSAVNTVAGQRLVVSLAPFRAQPRPLAELGMTEAEAKALQAMVERGRGLLLLCAPVGGGVSATYYALLAHAAAVGKTVYSVERSVEYEIPAVAQVMVDPAAPSGAAAYLTAGTRQDTDVVAIDGIRSLDEAHLVAEAAGMGKLVIATYTGGDVASGVSRLLALGVEPHSIAPILTMAVGQRLVRSNCPNCSGELRSPLVASLPGAPADLVTRAGAGCPNCSKTGFAGVTGLFEVLLFNERVRAAVAHGADEAQLQAVARGAGMRPLVTSGLAKVTSGAVSVEELDRVLRFSEQG